MKNIIFLSAIFLLIPFFAAAQQNSSSLQQRVDSLYEAYEDKQALELYKEVLAQHPDDYRALWRTSFLYSRIGDRFEDEDDQRAYFNRAIDLAERALKADSTDTQSNFVMAVAMGRKALISGARDRVAASRAIKKYADRAIAYDSTNAGAWHVLGRWHFKVANLSWIERAAANTLFGGIPSASTEKAAQYIERAIDLNDDYVLYYYDLAKVYEELGKKDRAIAICRKAQDVPNLTPDDEQIKRDCQKLIQNIQ